MPPVAPPADSAAIDIDELAVLATDVWLNRLCERVGTLHGALRTLMCLELRDGSQALVEGALGDCDDLQTLLTHIPIRANRSAQVAVERSPARQSATPQIVTVQSVSDVDPFRGIGHCGDNFPAIESEAYDELPSVDKDCLRELCLNDTDFMLKVLQDFRLRADGDLRELEMLSIGRDWLRLARLAGALKDSAAHVSASRIAVDAAALQGAARVGCRNDVDLALDALRADLRSCAKQVDQWLSSWSDGVPLV